VSLKRDTKYSYGGMLKTSVPDILFKDKSIVHFIGRNILFKILDVAILDRIEMDELI
jgi:hypothetical protein